jgi:signal peptidase II
MLSNNVQENRTFDRLKWGYAYLLILAGLVVIVDQVAKLLVREYLAIGEAWFPWEAISDYAVIVHTWNTGATLGVLRGTNGLFIAISEIACIVILFIYPRIIKQRNILPIGLGLGLILGGAAGNLIDRVAVGYVTDIFLIANLPVFNLADFCIILGALFLAMAMIFDPPIPAEG